MDKACVWFYCCEAYHNSEVLLNSCLCARTHTQDEVTLEKYFPERGMQINLSSAQLKSSVKMCLALSSLTMIGPNFSCIWL